MKGRVVFLVRNVAPNNFGGGEIYQLRLAEKLRKAGFEPFILTNSKKLIEAARTNDTKVLKPPYITRQNWSGVWNLGLPFYYFYQMRLRKWYKTVFKKYSPSVINIQSRDDYLAATQVAHRLGIKVLWTDHADFVNWVLNNVNVRFKNNIGKKIMKYSRYVSKIIFVSEHIKKQTERMILPREIRNALVVPNGVDNLLEEYKDIMAKKDSFVYVGRVVEDKGIGELLMAFKVVKEERNSATLAIYGKNDDMNDFRDEIVEGVKFCGATEEPLRAIAENDIFVLPSYKEGLSLSLLDAAMMGKKIIATSVGGNLEVVVNKKTGLLVPPKNVDELARAMLWMIENEAKANEMAKNARRLYKEKYDFEKIFKEQMLPLYKE